METLLGDLALAERDAQLDKLEHDRLQRGQGDTTRSLGDDHIVKSLQGTSVLADGDKLYGIQPEQKNARDEYCSWEAERLECRAQRAREAYRSDVMVYGGMVYDVCSEIWRAEICAM